MTDRFGDVLLFGVYGPTVHEDSKWTVMRVDDQTMISLADPVSPITMYVPGNVFRWSFPTASEKTWRVLRRIDDE